MAGVIPTKQMAAYRAAISALVPLPLAVTEVLEAMQVCLVAAEALAAREVPAAAPARAAPEEQVAAEAQVAVEVLAASAVQQAPEAAVACCLATEAPVVPVASRRWWGCGWGWR